MSLQDEKRSLQVQIDNARREELAKNIQHDNGLISYEEYKEAIDAVKALEINMIDLIGSIMLNED